MKKSVYSLVLSDEVVAAVDAAAYAAGMNRSAFVNSVLAEYVRYVTPEQRVASVLTALERSLTESGFRLVAPSSGKTVNVGTVLGYKYNPAVRYTVEVYKNTAPLEGMLRVSLRTTNGMLINELHNFFTLWAKLENGFGIKSVYTVEQGKLSRTLSFAACEPSDISVVVSRYIHAFDQALKAYFTALGSPLSVQYVKQLCTEYYAKTNVII